ncbi:MAG TPA: radical SAM protein, partial [Spirochaetia bacterium]|nr:radical SAM protein [Spirochaetia bacterium]
GRLDDFPGLNAGRARETDVFFRSLEAALSGRRPDADRVAYDFSFTRLPVLAELAVTYRCNNRCRFCYAGCSAGTGCRRPGTAGAEEPASGRSEIEDLPARDLEKILRIFKEEAKVPFFSFTGGEPLLREDLPRLVRYAVRIELRTNLVTNGTLATPSLARDLFRAGLRTAQVSLEAPEEELHDDLCGAAGAWERSVAGIRALMEAGISVQTNTTAVRTNLDALEGMPALAKSLGLRRMSLNLFIPTARSPEADALFVPYREIGPVVDRVRKRALEAGVEFLWYSPTPMCLYNPLARGLGNKNCAACDGLLSVNPRGDVLPCSSWDEGVGNLLSDGFEKVWFGDRAAALKNKEYAPAECRTCPAFAACQAACPLYWSYAGYGEIEEAGPAFRARHARPASSAGPEATGEPARGGTDERPVP